MVGRSTAHDGAHSDGRRFVDVEAGEEAQETCFWGDVGPAAVERESRNGPVEKLFSIFRFGNLPYMVSCFFDTSQPRRHPVTPRRSRHPRSFSLVFVHLGLSDTYDSKKKNAGGRIMLVRWLLLSSTHMWSCCNVIFHTVTATVESTHVRRLCEFCSSTVPW